MHPRYSRARQARPAPKKSNSWLSLFFAFILGYLFGYILNLEVLINIGTNIWHQQHGTGRQIVAKSKPLKTAEPKYEFYTMLQQNDSEILQPDIKADTTAADPLANKIIPAKPQLIAPAKSNENEQYVVQVAAFNDEADAEALKAKLAFQGYQMRIIPITQSGGKVYRVISPDLENFALASKWLQKFFTKAHLHGILKKKSSISN